MPVVKPNQVTSVSQDGMSSDEVLYRRFANGDEKAFDALLTRYGSRVFGYLVRFFGDRELASDLTQEVFIRVISAAKAFRGDSSFATFIFRITRNLCIDYMRSRGARPDSDATSSDSDIQINKLSGDLPGGDDRTLSDELSRALTAALAALPPEQREVFLMREFEGLRFPEIASLLGVNENTVKSRMHYAVMHLRSTLKGFWGSK